MFHVTLPDKVLNINLILYSHLYNLSLLGTTFTTILLTPVSTGNG